MIVYSYNGVFVHCDFLSNPKNKVCILWTYKFTVLIQWGLFRIYFGCLFLAFPTAKGRWTQSWDTGLSISSELGHNHVFKTSCLALCPLCWWWGCLVPILTDVVAAAAVVFLLECGKTPALPFSWAFGLATGWACAGLLAFLTHAQVKDSNTRSYSMWFASGLLGKNSPSLQTLCWMCQFWKNAFLINCVGILLQRGNEWLSSLIWV